MEENPLNLNIIISPVGVIHSGLTLKCLERKVFHKGFSNDTSIRLQKDIVNKSKNILSFSIETKKLLLNFLYETSTEVLTTEFDVFHERVDEVFKIYKIKLHRNNLFICSINEESLLIIFNEEEVRQLHGTIKLLQQSKTK